MINETQKITLTFGQLKRLVRESEDDGMNIGKFLVTDVILDQGLVNKGQIADNWAVCDSRSEADDKAFEIATKIKEEEYGSDEDFDSFWKPYRFEGKSGFDPVNCKVVRKIIRVIPL